MTVMPSYLLLLYFRAVFVIEHFCGCEAGDGGEQECVLGWRVVEAGGFLSGGGGGRWVGCAYPHLCVPCGAVRFTAGLCYPHRDAEAWNTAY